MAILLKILGVLSVILLICTLICGLWINSHHEGDMHFHFILSLISVSVALVTIVLFLFNI